MNLARKLLNRVPAKPEVLDRIVFGTLILWSIVGFFFVKPVARHLLLLTPYALGALMVLILCVAAFLSVRWAFWGWAIFTGLAVLLDALISGIAWIAPSLFRGGSHVNLTSFVITALEFIYVLWRLRTWTKRPEPQPLRARKAT